MTAGRSTPRLLSWDDRVDESQAGTASLALSRRAIRKPDLQE
jgi:hypothetical protein